MACVKRRSLWVSEKDCACFVLGGKQKNVRTGKKVGDQDD
jgi:hypothetical protein